MADNQDNKVTKTEEAEESKDEQMGANENRIARSPRANNPERSSSRREEFYLRYYVGHKGKFGHEFLEFEFQ